MKNPYLRVKLKSLAEEARIIRFEEQKAIKYKDYDLQASLRLHRIWNVRSAARETLLAYQFLRNFPYYMVEKPNSTPPNWKSVLKMANRYGNSNFTMEDIERWSKEEKPKLAA